MAKSNLSKVDEKKLKADIKAMKAAKTKEEVDKILAKYEAALAEVEEKPAKKAEPAKKEEPKKAAPAKKEEPKKTEPAKKAPVVVAAPAKKEEPKKSAGRQYNGKYEVYKSGDGWAYRLKASNGEVLVTSEVYASKESMLSAIEAVKKNVEVGEVKVYDDKSGKHQFKLVAKNHRVLVISANYDKEARAQSAAESFKKFALKADVVEIDSAEVKEDTPIEVDRRVASQKTGGRFFIVKEGDKFSWEFRAANGQILCQADGYNSVAAVESAIDTFKENVAVGSFKCAEDKNNRFFFKLYSPSGRVVGIGESYPAKASAESAAQSLATLVKKSKVEYPQD